MTTYTSDVAFSSAVKEQQERFGSRESYARMEQGRGWQVAIDAGLAAFIAARDSFYMATASADGQPYIQHRGGPAGFLKVLGPTTLGFADFVGNRQYISVGNLTENDRVSVFLMDYANRQRVKVWGRARVVEDDAALMEQLMVEGYAATPERAIVIEVEAWDVNCPQHITPRFTREAVDEEVEALRQRVAELEAENVAIRSARAAD